MFTDAQILYLEEVLGASSDYFRATEPGPEPVPAPEKVIVHTPVLSAAERALLVKILTSVKLSDYRHVEGDVETVASHRISFIGNENFGRSTEGLSVLWRLPALSEMLDGAPGMMEKKKTAWALLQQFIREINL
jgi:hypothetical protein